MADLVNEYPPAQREGANTKQSGKHGQITDDPAPPTCDKRQFGAANRRRQDGRANIWYAVLAESWACLGCMRNARVCRALAGPEVLLSLLP